MFETKSVKENTTVYPGKQLNKSILLPSLTRENQNKTKYETGKARLAGAIKIDKLSDSNFHIWKQIIDAILTYREVEKVIHQQSNHEKGTMDQNAWVQLGKQVREIKGLSLSDEMLEHVGGVNSAKGMLGSMYNALQHHTPLNKLRAHRELHTMEMSAGERMLLYINRLQYLGPLQKSIGFDIDNQEEKPLLQSMAASFLRMETFTTAGMLLEICICKTVLKRRLKPKLRVLQVSAQCMFRGCNSQTNCSDFSKEYSSRPKCVSLETEFCRSCIVRKLTRANMRKFTSLIRQPFGKLFTVKLVAH